MSLFSFLRDLFSRAQAPQPRRILLPDEVPWDAYVVGNDIEVRNVIVTAFGGGFDRGDKGETESGVMNDGRNPKLMGCALPVKHNEAATRPSPFDFTPPIPWGTRVEFWYKPDESDKITCTLIDNGPDVLKYPTHAGDLCVYPASLFDPHIPLRSMANAFGMRLSYRILGAAQYVPKELLEG